MVEISNSTNNSLITIIAKNVDFKVGGAVLLYTPPVGLSFFVRDLFIYYTTLTNPNSPYSGSFGNNATSYDNIISSPGGGVDIDKYYGKQSNLVNQPTICTNSLPLYFNITNPFDADVAIGNIVILGVLQSQ